MYYRVILYSWRCIYKAPHAKIWSFSFFFAIHIREREGVRFSQSELLIATLQYQLQATCADAKTHRGLATYFI